MKKNGSIDLHCATVRQNERLGGRSYRMRFGPVPALCAARPGQFVTLALADGQGPLLRRPFGVHRIGPRGAIEILYQVVGPVTARLAAQRPGERISLLGPLGTAFPFPGKGQQKIIFVAGGRGVAPLVFLAERLHRDRTVRSYTARSAVLGAGTAADILCVRDFTRAGCRVMISTDDGSRGKKGFVTDLLREILEKERAPGQTSVYACGPDAMLRAVARLARQTGVQAFGSFDAHMACGVGHCYGCVVKTVAGYRRACTDGPVFDLKEIVWEE